MAGKSFDEYPYKIEVMFPKGHFLGRKNSTELRSFLYKTLEKGLKEYESMSNTNPLSIQLIERKTKKVIK